MDWKKVGVILVIIFVAITVLTLLFLRDTPQVDEKSGLGKTMNADGIEKSEEIDTDYQNDLKGEDETIEQVITQFVAGDKEMLDATYASYLESTGYFDRMSNVNVTSFVVLRVERLEGHESTPTAYYYVKYVDKSGEKYSNSGTFTLQKHDSKWKIIGE